MLKEAGVPVTLFAGRESTHNQLNADIGTANDPGTKALVEFLDKALQKRVASALKGRLCQPRPKASDLRPLFSSTCGLG